MSGAMHAAHMARQARENPKVIGWKGRCCDNCLTRKRIRRAVTKPSNMSWAFYVMETSCRGCSIGQVAGVPYDRWEEDK